MARPKKPKYEYVEKLGRYRKRIKDSDGKYVAIYGRTPEELTAKLAEAQELIQHAAYRRDNPTVKEYAEKWLTMQSANIRVTTLTDYTSCVKNYIIEPIGHLYMADVKPDDVKMAMLKASQKSSSIYRKTQMLYKSIFASAVESNIIDKSPCDNLNPKGGKPPKEKQALNSDQIQTLEAAVAGLPVYPFVMLGLYAGLRREEALGLRWENVHLDGDHPYISIRTAWHTEHNRPVILDELKTKASRRDIPIPAALTQCLKEEKKRTISQYVIANSEGNPLSETQWKHLWCGVTNRTTKERTYTRYMNGKPVKIAVNPELGKAAKHNPDCVYSMEFVPTPHQLRHTYASNLIQAGVDPKTVQYLLGHEHSRITMDIYTHLIYNRPEDLAERINKAF